MVISQLFYYDNEVNLYKFFLSIKHFNKKVNKKKEKEEVRIVILFIFKLENLVIIF